MKRWALFLLLGACRFSRDVSHEMPTVDPTWTWSFTLERVVTEDGYVDYDRLESHRDTLTDYVAWLGQTPPPTSDTERVVLWLNANTAFTLYGVLEEGRPESVHSIPRRGLWLGPSQEVFAQQAQYKLGPEWLSISQLRNDYLRGRIQDPRIFAALFDATTSGPPLRPEIYIQHRVEDELDTQMRRWLNDPERGVRIEEGIAFIPPLLNAHEGDVWRWTPGWDLCQFTASFTPPPLSEQLQALSTAGCPHRAAPEDISLNHKTRPDRVQHPM